MNAASRAALAVAAASAFLLGTGAPARADTPAAGADVSVAQSLGTRELTVTIRRVTTVPGPLRVDIVTHAGSPAGALRLAVTPTGADVPNAHRPPPGAVTGSATVTLPDRPGPAGATLRIDRAGPWELSLGDGNQIATVPFTVFAPAVSPPERAAYVGFAVAGAALLGTLLLAAAGRRAWWAAIPAAAAVAGLAVATTGAVLTRSLPPPPQPGLQRDATVANATDPYAGPFRATDPSRPPANATLTAEPAGLRLRLSDAATGLPVDDLVVHDGALVHLMVTGPGGELWHLHPVRVGPGEYRAPLEAPAAGRYSAAAELERRGGGVQLIRAQLDLAAGVAAAPPPAGTAPVRVSVAPAVAGRPVTILASAGANADLQPWLGMLGHLIVVGPGDPATAPVWAHSHSMGMGAGMMAMDGMAGGMLAAPGVDGAPDETVAAYGPVVQFTFTFPLPGTYRAWIQVERQYTVITVPVTVTVGAS
ncbi:hypothetical protein [Dactylosporangium sp. CA-092794]|uniref:hypothetical protein n=1 Tax=Dactylosporangium sp. CA-092794 TaxID=3239929 RepID=UPI003D8C5E87